MTVRGGGGEPLGPERTPEAVRRLLRQRPTVFQRLFASAPPLFSLCLGFACVALGLILLVRPLASLSALVLVIAISLVCTGAAELSTAPRSAAPRVTLLTAAIWVFAGVAVFAWPGLTIRVIAVAVGCALIVDGVAGIAVLLGAGTSDARLTTLMAGVASVLFGALALGWPDVTLLVLAVIFGARLVFFGLSQIWEAGRVIANVGSHPSDAGRHSRDWSRRWSGSLGGAAALLLGLVLTGISLHLQAGSPTADAFYVPREPLPSGPGVVLKSEPFQRAVPAGAQAWRLLYTTTREDGTPAVASAIVVAPMSPSSEPRPVIAWAHGTTGFAEGCAPSLAPDPFGSGALFILDRVIEEGWVLVATDYIGLGTAGPHPYLIGQGEARSVLDAVRAAYQFPPLRLADEVVVWGHSQGGHAALWTGMLAPAYAPDVHVLGVAALAPASDLVGLVDDLPNITGGSVFAAYVVAAYTQLYPDVDFSTYIRPAAQVLVQEMSKRCLAEPGVFVSVLTALSLTRDPDIFALDPATGPFGERLNQNRPTGPIAVPLFIAQGLADGLVLPTVQQRYVDGRCAVGQALEYRTYAGRDHVGLVADDSPLVQDLIDWTQARLRGAPAASMCPA